MVILLFKDNMTTVQPVQSNGVIKGFAVNDKETVKNGTYATCTETGLDGPEQILPTDDTVTSLANGRVQLLLDNDGIASKRPISIPGLLMQTATNYPNQIALVTRPGDDGNRKIYTYKEYENTVRTVAKAFLKLGLEKYHSVCIIGFNSPEWVISDIAAIYAGGFGVGVYTTNSPEACEYCAITSRANIIVVEDSRQLEKVLKIKKNLPHLKAIIMYEETPQEKDVLGWDDVLKMGAEEPDDKLNEALKKIAVNECCTLVFTSGTVGNPKAAMLNHDNYVFTAYTTVKQLNLQMGTEILVSYLPLSHVAAQLVDIYSCMAVAGTLHFAEKTALKGTLVQTLSLVQPTVFLGIPRVWEKIYEKMQIVASNNGIIKTWISSWAKAQGLYYNLNKINGTDYKHWGYLFAKWLVFNNVKAALGFNRCHIFLSGAAPLSLEIKQYFMSLDILICDAYGMSESSGPHSMCTNYEYRLGSIGKTLPGFETKLNKPDAVGEGEICMRGRHVFMGYLGEYEKSIDALDKDRWLHTGDLGKKDSDGYIFVTGRIKELIITAGGENISPVNIEHLMLAELPALSNAILIGDGKKYLTMLVSLRTEMDVHTGAPKDTFTSDTLRWLQSIGSKSKTVDDVIKTHDPLVYEEIDKAIKRVNNKVISNAHKVQKFRILPHDLSIPTGELGPTLKLKRNVVYKMYESLIEDMYK
ncbi:very long-chain-fatty-acid--CoA ligase bubblegum isoform X2 [Hylaeus anthracinus]|uniref:very long-chain-fatty-acid--CoA ligase bubblegum isoform X2 n=1 Tax=Hylaeus anthracinus TaxID=313031 RepID=UPI0023B8D37A|nr:very long-chain-fatty-acid--CoA ligase bubblegum isoform X2 [Hylaeus anthracinus]